MNQTVDEQPIQVLVVVGSLREASLNRRLARLAVAAAPAGSSFDTFEGLRDVEPFDEDLEASNDGPPPGALAFTEAIRAADAVLVVTPEYNGSIPGVLKNAFDWASRASSAPYKDLPRSAMYGVPVAVMSASTGQYGGTWARDELLKALRTQGARAVTEPKVALASAHDAFDDAGSLAHQPTAERIAAVAESIVASARELRRALAASAR